MDIQHTLNSHIDMLSEKLEKREAIKKVSFKKDLKIFEAREGKIYSTPQAGAGFNEKSTDVMVNKVKLLLKKSPSLFSFVYHAMNPSFARKNAHSVVHALPKGKVIVNLGSGTTSIRSDVINIDFYPFENVDIVADIADLPFADESVDAIVSECVLEHVPNPAGVVAEIHRVLKPGGIAYILVPFVFTFHSSPHDYYRWSPMGLRELMRGFDETDAGTHFGAGNAVQWVLAEYLGTILSFGIKALHQVLFMLFLGLFTPLAYLDYIFNKFKTSENAASHIFFLGKKK